MAMTRTLETVRDEPVMLACGCAAHAKQKVGDEWVPSCVVHNCTEQIKPPELNGRLARCDCGKTVPSSMRLAFFVFQGDGSPTATEKCKCGAISRLHLPHWEATIKVARRWFKIERYESTTTKSIHAADEDEAKLWAEAEVQRWWRMGDGKLFNSETREYEDGLTKVNEVELLSLRRTPTPRYHIRVCSTFKASGAAEFDRYYCGCRGWN